MNLFNSNNLANDTPRFLKKVIDFHFIVLTLILLAVVYTQQVQVNATEKCTAPKPINPLSKPVFGTYQTHTDPLHGLLAVTDTSGSVIGQNAFDSFGKTIEKKISDGVQAKDYQPVLSFGFSGALNQPENSGLGLGTKYTIEGSTIKNSTLETSYGSLSSS